MHYYQHNIADYRKDTTHLSLLEHGVYRQLLDWAYLEQAPIPKETKVVFRRLRAITDAEQQAVIDCLNEFFLLTDDGYVHGRVSREIVAYEAKAGRAKENGKLGGRPLKTKVVISGNPEETQSKANSLTHKPINLLKQPSVVKRASKKCPADFEVTDDMRAWAVSDCPGVNVERATAKFRDHSFDKPKSDWLGTWKNWIRRDFDQVAAQSKLPAWREQQRSETLKAVPSIALGGVNPTTFFENFGAPHVAIARIR